HWLFLFSLLYMWNGVSGIPVSPAERLALWAVSVGVIFGSVLAHELGHCWGARRMGGEAEEIILWPLGGLAVLSGVEKGPREEIVITLLGPAVSVALAVVSTAAAWAIPETWANGYPWAVAEFLASTNWMLAIFNLSLPLFPMDCARIVRGALSMRWHPNRVTYYLTTFGLWLGGAIALAGFTGFGRIVGASFGPWLGLIGLLGAFTCYQERKRCEFVDVYQDGPWYWRDAIYRSDTAPPLRSFWEEMAEAARRLLRRSPSPARPRRSSSPRVIDASRPATARSALEEELEKAIREEDFLRAAQLRDQLKKMK
ncbi:MAG: site-2 protease family protein, partial [Candidatus Sumerlaeota bacterium]|nr:site-2 protease family protein [Candidatus Sumerlaeota bacterium]